MLLISAARAGEFASFDQGKNDLDIFRTESDEAKRLWSEISGMYAFVDQTRVLLYRSGRGLILVIGQRDFVIREETSARNLKSSQNWIVEKISPKLTFQILNEERIDFEFVYSRVKPERNFDLFPGWVPEHEDDDFMVFVANVINDQDRQRNIWL